MYEYAVTVSLVNRVLQRSLLCALRRTQSPQRILHELAFQAIVSNPFPSQRLLTKE